MPTCRHCEREIVYDIRDGWVDPNATGDDEIWRETCDAHDTFVADHEPEDDTERCENCGNPTDGHGNCVLMTCLHYRNEG